MKHSDTGDGDLCPVESEHGRMFMNRGRTGQYCPHQSHDRSGGAFWGYDGVTPRTDRSGYVAPISDGWDDLDEQPRRPRRRKQRVLDPFHENPLDNS